MTSPLLKRKTVLAAKLEGTIGTAESLTAAEAAFNIYNPMIQQNIAMEEREGQAGFGYLASVPGGYTGTVTFTTDVGWDGTATEPGWAELFFPACGFVKSGGVYKGETAPPGVDGVTTITIGVYVDGMKKSIKGAVGTFKINMPTGKRATIDWTFTGVWVTPTDATILDPTYPTTDKPCRAQGAATTFDSVAMCCESVTIDAGNEVVMRECATTVEGLISGIITNRNPKITCNPESRLVADDPRFTDLLLRSEEPFSTTIGSATGSGTIVISAPMAQIINIQQGDRNKMVIDELELQCNRDGNTEDGELLITFTADV